MGALSLWCHLCLFVVIGVVRETASESRNICDVCECLPSRNESSYVNCNCQKNKVLIIDEEKADALMNARVLNISGCTFVSFPPAGFLKAKKLKTVQIRQISGLFHFSAVAFPYATNFIIEDVNEIVMEHQEGLTTLLSIEIRNSVVNEIGEGVLKDVKSLEKLVFQNVTINTIAADALSIPNSSAKLTVRILNSKIDNIHSSGISLQVNKFEVVNTFMNKIEAKGLTISASDSIEFARCTFGADLSPESFQFRSNRVNFADNEFRTLPKSLLEGVTLINDKNKINFINNTIYDVDIGGVTLTLKNKLNFLKNKILCECTHRKTSILKLGDLFPGLDDEYVDTIIGQNSCKNHNGITLREFKRKFLPTGVCNETEVMLQDSGRESLESLTQPDTEISPNNSASLSYYCYYKITLICVLSSLLYYG